MYSKSDLRYNKNIPKKQPPKTEVTRLIALGLTVELKKSHEMNQKYLNTNTTAMVPSQRIWKNVKNMEQSHEYTTIC